MWCEVFVAAVLYNLCIKMLVFRLFHSNAHKSGEGIVHTDTVQDIWATNFMAKIQFDTVLKEFLLLLKIIYLLLFGFINSKPQGNLFLCCLRQVEKNGIIWTDSFFVETIQVFSQEPSEVDM